MQDQAPETFLRLLDECDVVHPHAMACKLTNPDPKAHLALVTDASAVACGATLEQLSEEGVWRLIGFWLRLDTQHSQCGKNAFLREIE